MALSWPKPCPAYFYLAFFLGGFGGGVLTIWWNDLWKSIPFWIYVIRISTFQTLIVFLAISAYRFFLLHWQDQNVCEESSVV